MLAMERSLHSLSERYSKIPMSIGVRNHGATKCAAMRNLTSFSWLVQAALHGT